MLTALVSARAQSQPPLSATAPWTAVIEHSVVLSSPGSKRTARMELSALAWNPEAQELVAASDRGVLVRYRLRTLDGQLQVDTLSSQRLAKPRQDASQAPAALNPEALAWRSRTPDQQAPPAAGPSPGGGELLLAGEHGDAVLRLSPDGRAQGRLPWPSAVAAALSARVDAGSRHGVEAIAWHARLGLLAALQRPVKVRQAADPSDGSATSVHWIHAGSGARWGFAPAGPHSQLKAIEARPDGSLLLLERVRRDNDPRLHTILRTLDPATCGEARLCPAPVVPIQPAPIVGDENHEGLACTDSGTCWLVNDGGPNGEQPTRLIQFRLVPR